MTESVAPIRLQIVVPTDPARSFDIFTRDISTWWPLAEHSVDGLGGTVAFDEGVLVETAADGTTSVWGKVLEWAPGARLRLTWHPGSDPEQATEVRVAFDPVETADGGSSTLVTLEHHGWERAAVPQGLRNEYEVGWPPVIRLYGAATIEGSKPRVRTPALTTGGQ